VRIWLVIWLHVWIMRYRDVSIVRRMRVVLELRRILLGRSNVVIVLLPPRIVRLSHHMRGRTCPRVIHAGGGVLLVFLQS
jgi:hypothetical protein